MQHTIKKYKKLLIAAACMIVAVLLYVLIPPKAEQPLFISASPPVNPENEVIELQQASAEPEQVYVDLKGAVRFPGVYPISIHARVVDAIGVAGGPLEQADMTKLNLAQKVQDEMVIYVPLVGEIVENDESFITTTTSLSSDKININQASLEELTTLTGVGPSKAQAIIDYREQQGPFQSIEELKNVTGIGEKTYEKLKDEIEI